MGSMAKPIMEARHRGKRVRVEFARERGRSIRYDIFVNDSCIKANLFAEEVMRWLGHAMDEDCAETNAVPEARTRLASPRPPR